jgi:phosphocarrier protein
MKTVELVVRNKTGLHARPATDLVNLCKKFACDVRISCGEADINPKSIVSILTGGVYAGSTIQVTANGCDEEFAIDEIQHLIENLQD